MATKRSARLRAPPDVASLDAAPVYLLVGDDEFKLSGQARSLVDRLCPEADQALGLEILEGRELTTVAAALESVRRCVEAVQTPGFFGVQKVVWFRDMNFLDDGRLNRSADLKAGLEPLVAEIRQGIQDGVRLVLDGPGMDRRSALFRACKEAGHVLEYRLPDKTYQQENQARERAQGYFQEAGIRISAPDLERFLGKVGLDTRQIAQEVEKVRLFLGDRDEAVWSDIQVIVSPAREASTWELQDAFGARDLAAALQAVRHILFQGGSPIGCIMGLQSRCRELILMKGCLSRGWCRISGHGDFSQAAWAEGAEVEAFFERISPNLKAANPYRVGRLARQAGNFGGELIQIQEALVQAHQAMVGGAASPALVLELALIRVLGFVGRAAG